MENTDPKEILNVIHQLRAGLSTGLLKKEEVIDWAEQIVSKDKTPDIFFIDLLLSSSISTNDISHYIGNYLNFETPTVSGRPLLGLLFKRFSSGELTLNKTVITLYELKNETVLSDRETAFVYNIVNDYDLARDGIYGTLKDIERQLENFLSKYADYTFDNYEKWNDLDTAIENKFENPERIESNRIEIIMDQQTAIFKRLQNKKNKSIKKVIIQYSSALFVAYLFQWWLFYFSSFDIPDLIPGTPINIKGLFLLGTLILFLWLLIKRLLSIDPGISIWKLAGLGIVAVLAAECPMQLVRQITLNAYTIGERLYFFSLAIIGSIFFSGIISFLITFKIKTKRTDVFTLFIILLLVGVYFLKRNFFPS